MPRAQRSALAGLALALLFGGPAHTVSLVVSGEVLDSQGKPLPGARAELIPQVDRFAYGLLTLQGLALPSPAAAAASDASGRFTLTAPEAGMWMVRVGARGFASRTFPLIPLVEPAELPEVRLEPDAGLKVRVLSREGQPLPGARVVVVSDLRGIKTPWKPARRLAVAGEDGTATLPRTEGEALGVAAVAAGHLGSSLGKVGAVAEIRLAPGCERKVEVIDRQKPVPGVVIRSKGWVLGRTDAAGSAAIAVPCEGEARLVLVAEDGRGGEVVLRPAPATAQLTLSTRPTLLSGRVLEAGTRNPVAGALVWFEAAPEDFVRTDAQGNYAVPSPGEVRGALRAAATGYLEATEHEILSLQSSSYMPGPTILLEPAAWVSGTVIDSDGVPVAGADLQVTAVSEGRWIRGSSERSDPRGLFRLRLQPGQRYEVSVSHKGFAPSREKLTALKPREERTGWRIVLDRGRTAFGRVLDAREQPVAGAEVRLWPESAERRAVFRSGSRPDPNEIRTISDAEGRFRFDHLTAGRFDLQADAQGFVRAVVPGVQVTEAKTDLGTVLLEAGVTLEGRVVDPKQKPIENARVALIQESVGGFFFREQRGEGREQVMTGPDGRFTLVDLRAGVQGRLWAAKEGYKQLEGLMVEVPSQEPVTITLEPALRLSGRVVDEGGSPVAATVMLPRGATVSADQDGRFTLAGIEAGRQRLTAFAEGFLAAEKEVEIPPGQQHTEGIEIVLRRGAVVIGRVLGPDGAPVTGASVQVIEAGPREEKPIFFATGQETDGDGNYRLHSVAEGLRSVVATHPEHRRTVRDLEVRAGENRLDLRMERGIGISGRVLDGAGRPVEAATVVLQLMSGEHRESASSADGSFRFPSAPTGTHRLHAEKEGHVASPAAEVQLASLPVAGVELVLARGGAVRGRVLGLEMKDLPGVHVSAQALGREVWKEGRVDYRGEYRIGDLAPGDWRVRAQSRSGWMASGQATVAGEGTETLLDLEFKRGLVLTGRVLRAGQPYPEATVIAVEESKEAGGQSLTAVDGTFRIEGLEPGSYRLLLSKFRKEEMLQHEEKIELDGDRDVIIDLPALRIAGRVVDAADNSPLSEASVKVEPVEGDRGFSGRGPASTDSTGTFAVEGLDEGLFRVVASKRGYAPGEAKVVSTESGSPEIVLALAATEGLAVEVVAPSGAPPSHLSTALLDPASGRVVVREDHTPGERGRIRISSAPPGRWRLLIASPESATTAVDVTIPSTGVRVVLLPAGNLIVTVPALAAGRQTAKLTLLGADGQPFRMVWGLSEWPVFAGKSEVRALPPGTWKLLVTAADGRTWQGVATTAAGAAVQVVLE